MHKQKRRKNSVQEMIGIIGFTRYGLLTQAGELLFFRVAPTNISVLSEANMEAKISNMTELLSAYPDIELCCVDAAENFDTNKSYLRSRLDEETNPEIRDLLRQDFDQLDSMQAEMATARQFMFVVRMKTAKERQVFDLANKVEHALSDRSFEAKRMTTGDIKRMLALYFDASMYGELMPDADGEQYFTEEFFDEEE